MARQPKNPQKSAKKQAKTPRKRGRPTVYSQAIADEICERLSDGQFLAAICRDEHMPGRTTVLRWADADIEFRGRLARAREVGADFLFDACLHIADDGSNDTYVDGEGNVKTQTDVIQRSRLRVDTRMRMASKLNPQRYGDKVEMNLSGEIGLSGLSDEALDARFAEVLARIGVTLPAGDGAGGK